MEHFLAIIPMDHTLRPIPAGRFGHFRVLKLAHAPKLPLKKPFRGYLLVQY
jgi:hypothetical protein